MADLKTYKNICGILSAGRACVLATIVNTRGSTPAGSLSKMLVIDGGAEIIGTVGGGCVEAEIISEARNVFDTGSPVLKNYTMSDDNIEGGLICGGEIQVFIELIDPVFLEFYEELFIRYRSGEDTVIGIVIKNNTITEKFLIKDKSEFKSAPGYIDPEDVDNVLNNVYEKRKVNILETGDHKIILEPVTGLHSLIIFGGGHISKYIAEIAGNCDFSVTIADDRSKFASGKRFPEADNIVCDDFEKMFSQLKINDRTFLIIVTRGHSYDEVVLEQAVNTGAGYIGMIGSKKKIKTLYNNLINRGVDPASFKNVFAPIGLDIGARTAEAIAVSILAEIIKFRELKNDNPARHLKETMKLFIDGS